MKTTMAVRRSFATLLALLVVFAGTVNSVSARSITTPGNASVSAKYYTQLNNAEQQIYNKLHSFAQQKQGTSVKMNFSDSPIALSGPNWRKQLDLSLFRAFDAYLYDHPEVFWLYKISADNVVGTESENGSAKVEQFTVKFTLNPHNQASEQPAVIAAMDDLMKNVDTSGSRYDQLASLYVAIGEWMDYNYSVTEVQTGRAGMRSQQVTSALIDRYTVCAGYAKAFKMGADRLGIPAISVSGTAVGYDGSVAHMWNMVQMEDGKWYAVDITWDDQSNGMVSDTFFLVGADTMVLGNTGFAQTHIQGTSAMVTNISGFTVPQMSSQRYTTPQGYLNVTGEPVAVVA